MNMGSQIRHHTMTYNDYPETVIPIDNIKKPTHITSPKSSKIYMFYLFSSQIWIMWARKHLKSQGKHDFEA